MKEKSIHDLISIHRGFSLNPIPRRKIKALLINYFADSMLTTIAMEYGDDAYVKHAVEIDENCVEEFNERMDGFLKIRNEFERRKKEGKNKVERRYNRIMQAMIILIEMNMMFEYFPFRGSAAIILEDIRGMKNPYKYSSNLSKNRVFNRASDVWKNYVEACKKCHAYEEMKVFIEEYKRAVFDNVPKRSAPFMKLHFVPDRYDAVATMYENMMYKYFEILEKNVINLKS